MSSNIDELTVNYYENDLLVVKELDKIFLSKGSWTTILFKYRQWDKKKEEYGPERYTIRRYRKFKDAYKQQGKFNISSRDQAKKIIAALQTWLDQSPDSESSQDFSEDDDE